MVAMLGGGGFGSEVGWLRDAFSVIKFRRLFIHFNPPHRINYTTMFKIDSTSQIGSLWYYCFTL